MGIFKRKKRIEKKDIGRSDEQSKIIIGQEYESEMMLNGNYTTIAKDAFIGNPDGFAVVDRVATAVAKLEYVVYEENAKGEKEYLPNHPALELLKRPNLERGQFEYVYELVMFMLLSGKMFQKKMCVANVPQKLYACSPHDMGFYLGKNKQLGWVFDYNGEKRYYKKDEISYLKFPHPLNEFDGLSPLQSAAYSIDGNNASDKWNFSMIKNGARPSGILKTSQVLSEPNWKRLVNMLKGWMGVYNANKGVILDGGLEWQQLSLSQKDMDNYNYTKLNSRKIAQVLGVPVALIDPDAQTYANYKEANKAFHIDRVIPFASRMVDEWNNWLMPAYGENVFLEIDLRKIDALKEDEEKTTDISRKDYDSGIITRAEARIARGMNYSEEDEVYKVGLQDVFINEDGNIIIPAMSMNSNNEDKKSVKSIFDNIEHMLKKKENKGTLSASIILNALNSLDYEELHSDVEELYYTLIAEEGTRVMSSVLELDKSFDVSKKATEYIEENVLQNCETILDETLREKIKVQMVEGSKNNETLAQIKSRIENVFEEQYFLQSYPNQLEVIARTEALTASSVATQDAYIQSEVVLEQEWITTLDGREREWHDTLNGQSTRLNEYFVNEKGKLKFPRDPSASADNVIQCRCSTIPIVEGSKQIYDTIEKKEELWKTQDEEAMKYVDDMKENYDKAFRTQLDNVLKALDNA